jgi:hypothetical protein
MLVEREEKQIARLGKKYMKVIPSLKNSSDFSRIHDLTAAFTSSSEV